MTTERLARADKRLALIVALIMAASIGYTALNYQAAFPEASIDLRLSKTEITALAEKFLREQGLSPAGFRNLTLFDPDDGARIYLEREVGLAEANRLMQGQVAVWRWRARWFRPPDKEEMLVYVSPGGTVAGFDHVIPESAPGARLDKEAARRLAAAFLAGRTQAPQRVIEEQLQERPARYDYIFTWEQEGFRAKDAPYRRTIVIHGDRVGRYSEYLYVPEKWRRDFATLRSSNDLYYRAAEALYLLLALAAVGVLIQSLRRRAILWKPLLLIAAVVGVLTIVNEWNSIPFFIDAMPTSSPYPQSLFFGLLAGFSAGIGVFFYVILAAAAGEPLYRSSQPARLSLLKMPTPQAVCTKEFFRAVVTGYGFAAFHIAFVVAFYLAGRRFGVWSPQDINYSDFLSTRLPWIYPLTISLVASTSEEFWFRLLAIPLLKRYLRSTWLAVIIPAFVWGFLHSNYPQQPGYIRGLEVGVIGIAAGFLMLRFGILATLVWHYTVDAVMIGMFLLRAGSWYFQLSGWLVAGAVLFPLAVSLVYYRRHGGFLAGESLLNAGLEVPAAETPAPAGEVQPAAAPLPPKWPVKWLYLAAGAAALAGLAAPRPAEFGGFIRVRLSRREAESAASRELRSRVPNLEAWRRVTEFQANLGAAQFEYVRRISGSRAANAAVRDHTATGLWNVRFFQPLRKEEWRVSVDQQARIAKVDHVLDEKAPGARLSEEEARRIAESYLLKQPEARADRFRLVDYSSDRKDRRTDHSFVWEDQAFRLGEAKARISLDVLGDEVSGFDRFLKLPEEWLREFQKPRLSSIPLPAAVGAAGLLLLLLLVKRLSGRAVAGGHRFHWRAYAALGAVAAGFAAALEANRWPLALAGYDTAKPIESYLSELLLGRAMTIALAGFAFLFAALAADAFLQWAAGGRPLRRPSMLRAAAVFLLLWGVARVGASAGDWVGGPRLSLPLWQLPGAGAYSPAVAVLGQAFLTACAVLCALAVLVSAAARFLKPSRQYALAVLAALLYAAGRAQNAPQFLYYALCAILASGAVIFLVRTCAADLVTFGLALAWRLVAGPATTLLEQPEPVLRWNGVAAVVAAVAVGLVLVRLKPQPR